MSFIDRVRAQAEQAMAKAQDGIAQGQSRLDDIQTKRVADNLLRNLGAAYYAASRQGGPQEAVDAAMSAIDRHVAENGPVDTAPQQSPGGVNLGQPQQHPNWPTTPPPTTPPEATTGDSINRDDG